MAHTCRNIHRHTLKSFIIGRTSGKHRHYWFPTNGTSAEQAAENERQRRVQQAAALEQQRRLAAAIAEQKKAFEDERERQRGWEIMRQGLGMMNQPKATTCQFNTIMNSMVCR